MGRFWKGRDRGINTGVGAETGINTLTMVVQGKPPVIKEVLKEIKLSEDMALQKVIRKFWAEDSDCPMEYVSYNLRKTNLKKDGTAPTYFDVQINQSVLSPLSRACLELSRDPEDKSIDEVDTEEEDITEMPEEVIPTPTPPPTKVKKAGPRNKQ